MQAFWLYNYHAAVIKWDTINTDNWKSTLRTSGKQRQQQQKKNYKLFLLTNSAAYVFHYSFWFSTNICGTNSIVFYDGQKPIRGIKIFRTRLASSLYLILLTMSSFSVMLLFLFGLLCLYYVLLLWIFFRLISTIILSPL
jgi:hypothetical protein